MIRFLMGLGVYFFALLSVAQAQVDREFTGARSESMGGAHRGVGSSNDSIYTNAAAMSFVRRFSVDLSYGYSSHDDTNHFNISALDSKSGAVAGAVGYTFSYRDPDLAKLHRIYLASAYPISRNLSLGVVGINTRGEYLDDGGERQEVESYSIDLSLAAFFAEGMLVGVTYHRLINTTDTIFDRPFVGVGVGYNAPGWTLGGDLEIGLDEGNEGEIGGKIGAEYLIAHQFPLRIGYRYVPFTHRSNERRYENILGAGLGWLTETGSVEVAYTHSIERQNNWDLIATMKFLI